MSQSLYQYPITAASLPNLASGQSTPGLPASYSMHGISRPSLATPGQSISRSAAMIHRRILNGPANTPPKQRRIARCLKAVLARNLQPKLFPSAPSVLGRSIITSAHLPSYYYTLHMSDTAEPFYQSEVAHNTLVCL